MAIWIDGWIKMEAVVEEGSDCERVRLVVINLENSQRRNEVYTCLTVITIITCLINRNYTIITCLTVTISA